MKPRPKVLILYASAGAGHMFAARALVDAVVARRPDADVQAVDVLEISGRFFRRLYGGGYLAIVRHTPHFMGWLHDHMDSRRSRFAHVVRANIQRLFRARIALFLRSRSPDLIVHTHYLPAELAAEMRRAGRLTCPQVVVTTDYETHRMWLHEPMERYYTATPDGKAYLVSWGVAPDRIAVTGIPVRKGFDVTLEQAEARRRCALEAGRPVVLVLCGGFGVGLPDGVLDQLALLSPGVQVVALTGRNERLRCSLAARAARERLSLRPVGFTERVHEWMRAADIAVTKAGGLTIAEALACALPVAILNPIPGHETDNSDYVLERGAAIKVNKVCLLARRLGEILGLPGRLETMRAAARALSRPEAADQIAADALRFLA